MKIRFAVQSITKEEIWTEWVEFTEKRFPFEWSLYQDKKEEQRV